MGKEQKQFSALCAFIKPPPTPEEIKEAAQKDSDGKAIEGLKEQGLIKSGLLKM